MVKSFLWVFLSAPGGRFAIFLNIPVGFQLSTQQFYLAAYFLRCGGPQSFIHASAIQIKQRVAVTVNRATIMTLEGRTLRQLDPVGDLYLDDEVLHSVC